MPKPQYTQKFRDSWLCDKELKRLASDCEHSTKVLPFKSESEALVKKKEEARLALFTAAHTSIRVVDHLSERVLKKDKQLHPYKIQLVQELKDAGVINRLNFANEMMNRFTLINNVLFFDEAHFHIKGHVNKQNCRY
ncbi:hypothetical protein EVAR_80242_1 [Eumeta japonica]|uniref:Uncharacterized protein n=1 Tax=Eumeta variegata TaxID=151549 RepID=A0A4C1UB24_EUMVA|nr:hypothetical protein EVAR_80242_1 [Eumeta japonica]